MIIYPDLEQGSDEWLRLRLGTPTTSNFGKIVTPRGTKSSQFTTYQNKLIAELITGERESTIQTDAMLRGIHMEADAVQYYEHYYNCIIDKTIQCNLDTENYNKKHIILYYFCGTISSKHITDI